MRASRPYLHKPYFAVKHWLFPCPSGWRHCHTAMAPKRKKDAEVDDVGSDEEAQVDAKPKKRASKPKAAAPTEPFTTGKGWNVVPPSLIWRDFETEPNSKIAGLDFDGTLANCKSGAQFPRTADDWKLYNKKVKKVLQGYVDDGYKLVIFSNQGGIKSALTGAMATKVTDRIENVVKELGVPAQVFLGTQDDENRKPKTGMWEFFKANCNGGVEPDMSECFFIGDAAGRQMDFSDSDKMFAANVGIEFRTPEDVFGEMDGKRVMPTQAATGEANSLNTALVDCFTRLADHYAGDRFKGSAYKKVAAALGSFPAKIEAGNLKEVAKLPGVGKGSMVHIKEFVETGKVTAVEQIFGEGAPEGAKEAAKEAEAAKSVALKFM